ncbi:MAG: PDZ domain-containing protein [Bacillota bacterium]
MKNSSMKTAVFVAMALVAILMAMSMVWPASAAEYGTNPQSSYWYQLPYLGIIWSRRAYQADLGFLVENVMPNSPADACGLRRGDYIVAIQKGFNFFMPHELSSYCYAGDVVLVICKRRTGAERYWWEFTTFGRYVRLTSRPNRPLREGEV